MPTTTRRKLLLTKLTVDIGCGSCRTPKLLRIFHPKPKPTTATATKTQTPKHYTKIYHDNSNIDYSSTPFLDTDIKSTRAVKGFGRIGDESVAVEKDSGDPYLDFRHSMLQMILENEIYSKDDLRELLNCFLQLNSPCNHGIIIRAFTDIWNAVFSVRSGTSSLLLQFARSNRSRDY